MFTAYLIVTVFAVVANLFSAACDFVRHMQELVTRVEKFLHRQKSNALDVHPDSKEVESHLQGRFCIMKVAGRILAVPPRKLETRDGTPRLRCRTDRIPSICRLKAAFRWYCQDAPKVA